MELKYVGAKPTVSSRGVSFDQTKPDKYTFLNAAVELLEALSHEPAADRKIYIDTAKARNYNSRELTDLLKKYCNNLDDVFATREEKTNELIKKYTKSVEENPNLNTDERRAWLGNIAIMRDYYLHYVTNESAYQCALNALADEIAEGHVDEIIFPVGRNYGLVLSHLIQVLTDHKPPFDAALTFEEDNGKPIGRLNMHGSKARA